MSGLSNTQSEKVAVETSYDSISYAELDRQSEMLALQLGSYIDGDVILLLKPDTRFYVALLACKKAGHPVVPLDVAQAPILLRDQFKRLNVGCLITTSDISSTYDDFPQDQEVPILLLDQAVLEHTITSKTETNLSSDRVLHRVFTSGSSEHQSLVSIQLNAMLHDAHTTSERYGFKSGMSIASLGRPTSSLGINGFWRSFFSQTTLLSFDLTKETMHQAWQRIADNQVQVLQGQTSLTLRVFKSQPEGSENRKITHLILGGEPLETTQLAVMMHLLPCLEIVTYNYSSTETMLIACYTSNPTLMLNMQKIPVGYVAHSKSVHILDEEGNPVKNGEIGHIVVQSSYIASHIDNPQGRRRLWQHDEKPNERIFHTGDLGRINSTGLLEHYGRSDREIKIQGKRINLTVIESELRKMHNINEAAVVAVINHDDDVQIIAVVTQSNHALSEGIIFEQLALSLPLAFVPKHIVTVLSLPKLSNGKPDYKAINAVATEHVMKSKLVIHDAVNAYSDIQDRLISVWSEVLRRDIPSVESSVFAMGADSLAIFQATIRFNEQFSVSLDNTWILDHPSIKDQEQYLKDMLVRTTLEESTLGPEQVRSMLGWS